jgi:uncharacterized protein YegJ (DUF2314 family)
MEYLTSLFMKSLVAGTLALFIGLIGRWIYRRCICDQGAQFNLDNPALQEAVSIAREGLPQFWRAFEKPSPGQEQFMVQVRIPCDGGEEHIWCHVAERNGNLINGVVANRPLDAPYSFGDNINFCDEDISDWLYFYLGRQVGGETSRAIENAGGFARA